MCKAKIFFPELANLCKANRIATVPRDTVQDVANRNTRCQKGKLTLYLKMLIHINHKIPIVTSFEQSDTGIDK